MTTGNRIYTDGANIGNTGSSPGGWAVLLTNGRVEKIRSGREAETTNNRMELTAAIQGVETLKPGAAATLFSDSKYVVDGWTKYFEGWKARGWRKADKKPVLNQDLWLRFAIAMADRQVTLEWVRGHAGHSENERVDQLAEAEARKAAQEVGWTAGSRYSFTAA